MAAETTSSLCMHVALACITFYNMLLFCNIKVFTTRKALNMEDHTLLAVCNVGSVSSLLCV